jgi:pyruvate kinase
MIRARRSRIVATIGPASSSPEMIVTLAKAGADVFRLNFSHGAHETHAAVYAAIRAAEPIVGRPLGILADLQGPKLRVGKFANGPVQLKAGQAFRFDSDPTPGDETRVHLPHPEILTAMRPGATLLLDDGKLRMTSPRQVRAMPTPPSSTAASCPSARVWPCRTSSSRCRR